MCPLSLESFETILSEDNGPPAAYQEGYDEGYRAGLVTAATDNATLTASLVQTIGDINFTYAEARAQALQSLEPLFQTLTAKLLPHCVSTGFAGLLSREIADAAASDTDAIIRLHVHPDQEVAVAQAIRDLPGTITILPDPSLDLHAAWIQRGTTETELNLDRLLAQITDALEAITPFEDRTESNG